MIHTDTLAGIDIGSNAIRLIIKDVIPNEDFKHSFIKKRAYIRLPLRLGGDVFKYGEIRLEKEQKFIKALDIYKDLLNFYGVNEYLAVATSATRSAVNGAEIITKIKEKTDIQIDVITGIVEAEMLSRTNKFDLPAGKIFVSVDLGGGSLQLSVYNGEAVLQTFSFKIGTVRMINNLVETGEIKRMHETIKAIKQNYDSVDLIGAGGNINKISKMADEKTLEFDDIENVHDKLKQLSVRRRMLKYNLRFDRADVIVPAAELYMNVMKQFGKNKIYIPKVGIADALIYDLFHKRYG
ncbi:MAG: hypothetical protein U9N85_07795 [Bacteroidota bacterium]|nr:hypothetical protein [Bacteroidota bacterium]